MKYMINKNLISRKSVFFSSFLLSAFCFLLFGCSNTGPQSGSLSGTIHLEGETDYSNITIGVYDLAVLDPDIVEANQKWPHIGVIINQHTEFDHRFGTLIKTGETDASGYFEINDIPTGIYNIVAIKDSFGFRYVYNVIINENDNHMTNDPMTNDFYTLYPETTISDDISSPTTWQSDHHYVIEQDIIVDDELTIEPGAVVRLNEGVKMYIYGDLTAVGQEDNFIWFTVNDSILPLAPSPPRPVSLSPRHSLSPSPPRSLPLSQFNRIELDGTLNKQVSYCKFDHAGTGLLSKVNGFEISDCIFRDSQCGFKAEGVDSTFCSNLLCENITGGSEAGIYFSHVTEGCIEKNIVNNCENGIKIKDGSSPDIENNICLNNSFSIELYSSNSNVRNNELNNNERGIRVCGPKSPEILYNNIKSETGILIGFDIYYVDATPIFNNNNIKSYNYCIYTYPFNRDTINAKNNYFYTTNANEIGNLIFDMNDVIPDQQQYYGIVNYEPFLIQEYPYAGIQDNK